MSQVSQYEVRCASCDVSFPVGTKRCIHCGGRTGPSRLGVGARVGGLGRGDGFAATEPQSPAWTLTPSDTDVFQGGPVELEDEQETPRRTLLRSAGTLIWVAMLIGFSLLRACSEE